MCVSQYAAHPSGWATRRVAAVVTPPSRDMERRYVCMSLLFASVHMTDRGCRRHAHMPCRQAAQVPMCASYSNSHICTRVCMHYSALPCARPRRPLLLSLHHAYAHACSRMPLAPSAHAYARVCVHVKHMLRSAGEKGGSAADTLSTHLPCRKTSPLDTRCREGW